MFITTQYFSLGVTFPEGNDNIILNPSFVNDGSGLHDGLNGTITLSFLSPMNWIAADFPGGLRIKLYSDNQLIYTSNFFGPAGTGNFGGLVSTESFDKAVLSDDIGGVFIDDLHFGPPIPAPGGLMLFGVVGLFNRSRQRKQS